MSRSLGEFEILILSAVLRLGSGAYGATITREIEERTGRETSPGAVYTGLDRLERKRLVRSSVGEATPERGGRRRRYYGVTAAGARALADALEGIRRMSQRVRPALRELLSEGS